MRDALKDQDILYIFINMSTLFFRTKRISLIAVSIVWKILQSLVDGRQFWYLMLPKKKTPPTRLYEPPSVIPSSLSTSPLSHSSLKGKPILGTEFEFNSIAFRKSVVLGRNGNLLSYLSRMTLLRATNREESLSQYSLSVAYRIKG